MAMLSLLYCLTMPRSNRNFFEVYGRRPAIRKLAGLEFGSVPSQSTFEYALRRFEVPTIQRCRAELIKKMRRNKMFPKRVVAAIDATEISVPNDSYEDCGTRRHETGSVDCYYKVIIVSLVGKGVPPVILGVALDNLANELTAAKKLVREIIYRHGRRIIDVLVADRLYLDHQFINELKNEHHIDVILEPKAKMNVLEEGLSLLEYTQPEAHVANLHDESTFRLREVGDVSKAWDGLATPLRFIEAHQLAPWPDHRGKRSKRTRHIITTLEYGSSAWIHQCLRDRWWLENENWDLKHRFQLHHLPSKSRNGIEAYLQFLAMAYSLFQLYLVRKLGGVERLAVSLTSFCDTFVRALWALDANEIDSLVYFDTS